MAADQVFWWVFLALFAWAIWYGELISSAITDWVITLAVIGLVSLPLAAAVRFLIRLIFH